MAQREIALAIGEPPATKGYPPSCFAKLPQLVERSGNGPEGQRLDHRFLHRAVRRRRPAGPDCRCRPRHSGRAHRAVAQLWPSRALTPAIDIEASASRVMHNVVTEVHLELARRYRQLYSRYQKSRDLIQLGAYVPGSDPETDRAIALYPALQGFLLLQGMCRHEPAPVTRKGRHSLKNGAYPVSTTAPAGHTSQANASTAATQARGTGHGRRPEAGESSPSDMFSSLLGLLADTIEPVAEKAGPLVAAASDETVADEGSALASVIDWLQTPASALHGAEAAAGGTLARPTVHRAARLTHWPARAQTPAR
jgi:hypothetical protein